MQQCHEFTYPRLTTALARLADGDGDIHLGLAAVQYCDLAGLRALIRLSAGHDDRPDHEGRRVILHGLASAPQNRARPGPRGRPGQNAILTPGASGSARSCPASRPPPPGRSPRGDRSSAVVEEGGRGGRPLTLVAIQAAMSRSLRLVLRCAPQEGRECLGLGSPWVGDDSRCGRGDAATVRIMVPHPALPEPCSGR
jgi:hypothetical protein